MLRSLRGSIVRFFHARPAVSREMHAFIEKENRRFDKFLESTVSLRSSLYDEAVNMLIPEGMTPPELNKGFFYFQRYDDEGRLRFCRVPADSTGKLIDIDSSSRELEEEILSVGDVAKRFSENGFSDISAAKISIDNQLLGFVVDLKGDERWSLMFRDLPRQEYVTSLRIPLVRNFEWIDNTLIPGRYLYFTEMDPETLRSVRVVRADLEDYENSRQVVWELDSSETSSYIDLFKSKDGKCIFMSSSSKTKSEVYVVPSDDPKATPRLVQAPEDGVEYYCEHREGFIYMVSNKDFTNFALYRTPIDGSNPMELMYHSSDMTISDIDMFRKGLALYGHGFEGQPAVEVVRFKGCVDMDTVPEDLSDYDAFDVADIVKIPFKGNYAIGKVEVGVNGDFESDSCRFTFRSVKNPGTCLEFRFNDRKLEAIKSREFQRNGGADMTVDRIGVPSMDGTVEIPLTVVIPETDEPIFPRPCLVHVYGAYGQVLEPDFSPSVISLLKRGWIVAFAHVRGGGERGPEWHIAGSKQNRWKSVTDLESCCRWLISERLTSPSKLFAAGASAGGVVLGSALNVYGKSLIGGGAILRVPFVDLFNTLKDPSLPLSTHEKEEWGDVDNPTESLYIESICPSQNVETENPDWYPPLFITSAQDDARVPYEGVVNYAMKLRSVFPPQENNLLVKTYMSGQGGHFGSISSAGDYNDTCTELAFLIAKTTQSTS